MPDNPVAEPKRRKKSHAGRPFRMTQSQPKATLLGPASQGLLRLVDELLLNIIDFIDSKSALGNLAATCARFHGLVEPYIWRELLVVKGIHARNIAYALDLKPERLDYVQDLSVRYKYIQQSGISKLNHPISLMRKLRHLTIESPCPNNNEWRLPEGSFLGASRINYEELLGRSSIRSRPSQTLPVLQSLTIHAHHSGDRKFIFGAAEETIFHHATLRRITLSCVNFGKSVLGPSGPEKQQKSTPLQSLTLIECNINILYLEYILTLPKALKELSVGERLYTFKECEPNRDPVFRTSSPEFLKALQHQAHSLERLTHIGGCLEYQTIRIIDPEGVTKIRSLTKLEYLELGFESALYFYLRHGGFPPSLRTLKMNDAALAINAGDDFNSLSVTVFRSIDSLVLRHLPSPLPQDFSLHLKLSHQRFFVTHSSSEEEKNQLLATLLLDRQVVYRVASTLKAHKASFCVIRECFKHDIYIPPFMYGEDLPFDIEMYDSNDPWRVCGIDFRPRDDPNWKPPEASQMPVPPPLVEGGATSQE